MFAKIYNKEIKTDYNNVEGFNRYPSDLMTEYVQSMEEGLDIEKYKPLFEAVSELDNGEYKTRMSDVIYEMVINAKMQKDYKYNEPSEWREIKKLRKPHDFDMVMPDEATLRKKLLGAWTGRAVGCLLGKPIEHINQA